MLTIPDAELQRIIDTALAEDVAWGDITTEAMVPADLQAQAVFLVKGTGVLCGAPVAERVFKTFDPSVEWQTLLPEGARIQRGDTFARVRGSARSLLTAERVALNLLQRMSGIATLTRRYVDAVAGTKARIIDTRKTTPGLRALEKYAVRTGGGFNHRHTLADGVLIKDNHIAALGETSLTAALKAARERIPHTLKIEVEVTRLDQIEPALAGGADILLLDNMTPPVLREAVALVNGRALTEASGGVNLDTVRPIAETGVDLISVGALTHSVTALDISLELDLLK